MTHRRRPWGRWWLRCGMGLLALMAVMGTRAWAADLSPYYLVLDPASPNPAMAGGGLAGFAFGPIGAEVMGVNVTAEDIGEYADTGTLPSTTGAFRYAARGGIGIGFGGLQLSLSAAGAGSGDFTSSPFAGYARSAVWAEAALRGGLPVPMAGRLLGLQGLRVGAGVHVLQGQRYHEKTASSEFHSTSGSGTAFDVGLAAQLSSRLTLEAAYLGAGQIRWVDNSNTERTYTLPTTLYTALRWRAGLVELLGAYSQIGLDQPEGAQNRLQAELLFQFPLVRAAVGGVQDGSDPMRLYVRLSAGPVTVGLLNPEEAFKGPQGKNFGVLVRAGFGI